jgi:hypothetical protein
MSQRGQGAVATAAQRTEVERLRGEGVSIRLIAARVFGDARYRGRVERILASPSGFVPLAADPILDGVDVSALGTTELTRLLVERKLALWALSGKAPPMSELKSLLDVERRLQSFEQVERARQRLLEARTPD